MIFLSIIGLIVGFIALIYGADKLVEGAASLARRLRISDLIIGLTIVAFGTSFPEFLVNMMSAIHGTTDLALGNVVGSNIFNILVILGLSACFTTLYVQSTTQWIEIPLALLSALVLIVLCNDILLTSSSNDALDTSDGIILLLFFTVFMSYIIYSSLINRSNQPPTLPQHKTGKSIFFIIFGLLCLVLGAEAIVRSATYIAKLIGISERVIGLTIVAIGTSLPELATSVVAARKKNMDIAIANIVGSNIFNSFFILGVTACILPIPIGDNSRFDILVNLITTLLLFIFLFIGKRRAITLTKGIIFICCYLAYVLWLFFFTA